MTRRRQVALISAGIIGGLAFLAVTAVLVVTRTDFGRERIRQLVLSRATGAFKGKGKLYIGHLSGSMFTELAVDSFSIYDADDSLVIATGPVRVTYDPRDIFDGRIILHTVDIARPMIHLRRHSDDVWNYRRVFPPSPPSRVPRSKGGLGDYIVADSVLLHDGAFWLTEPWAPDDSLKGARRDSAIRFALKRPWPEVRESKEGLTRTRRWTSLRIDAPWVRIVHPDSSGVMIRLAQMNTVENDPPADFRNMRGTVRVHGDSVWMNLSHVELPGTTAAVTGRVWWGDNKPVRLDIRARADTTSLADFNWAWPAMPKAGGGRTNVYVHNDAKNLAALDVELKGLDLRTTRSHLRGDMTISTGWPVLVLKDVALSLEPADFDLLREVNGGTFPVDFRGAFTGRLVAPGGRIDRWVVDTADLVYHDAHVPDARSHLIANGTVDLLFPSRTRFLGFDVDLEPLDLRTITTLFPSFPRLHGTVSGTATLDSVWTDVRVSDADLTHTDGAAPPSHIAGGARVTLGERWTRFDATLQASPLSFTTLAASYPSLPLRGTFDGPIRVLGTTDQLALTTRLTGAAGTLAVDEVIDVDTLAGVGAKGTLRLDGVDVRRLAEDPSLPPTRLFVAVANDVHGDSLATATGNLDLTLDSSHVADIYVPHGTARITVADGHLHVDSALLNSTGIRLRASGMLGVKRGARDTLAFTMQVDSLGGLRSVISPPDTGRAGALVARAERDTLAGTLSMEGKLIGSVADSFTARATYQGDEVVFGQLQALRVAGGIAIGGLPRAPDGTVRIRFDSLRFAHIGFDTLDAVLAFAGADTGSLALAALSGRPDGKVTGSATLGYRFAGDTLRVTLDTLALATAEHTWELGRPARFVHSPGGDRLDSLVVGAGGGSRLLAVADLPQSGEVRAMLALDSLPLGDLGLLAQLGKPLAGSVTGDLRISGTRAAPAMNAVAHFRDAKYGTFAFPYFTLNGVYRDRRLASRLDFYERGQDVASLALDVAADLAFTSVAERFPDAPLTGRIAADSLDLSALSAVSPYFAEPQGLAATDVRLSGTTRHPLFTGTLRLRDAAFGLPRFGVRYSSVQAEVRLDPRGITIDTLSMKSGAVAGNYLTLTGTIHTPDLLAQLSDRRSDTLDLIMKARNFQLLDSRRFARVELTNDVGLQGPWRSLVLNGRVVIDKADFYINDLSRRSTVIDLDDPELFPDSAVLAGQARQSAIPSDVHEALRSLRVEDLQISLGDKVWLRSEESEIKLGGAVELIGSTAPIGRIEVQRGSYRLNLGIVQRTFQVDSGSVSFYGNADRAGALDIWASSTVRTANRQQEDVKIIVHLTGTTQAPVPEFSSGERTELSQTEIFNYLLFGQATALDPNSTSQLNPLSRTLSASLGTVMESALAGQLKLVDQLSIQTGNPQQQADATSVLAQSRIGVGKQIGDRTYVSANVGLCFIQSSSYASLSQQLALSVEQRLSSRFYVMASMEPSSAALLCGTGGNIASRPQQFGLDLFHEWSF